MPSTVGIRASVQQGSYNLLTRTGRSGGATNGAHDGPAGEAPWLIRAIAALNSPRTDDLLIELLQEPEYRRWVAEEFPKLAVPTKNEAPFGKIDYGVIWAAREGHHALDPHRDRRMRFAAALREYIAHQLEQYRQDPKSPLLYLLKELAKALAALDPRGAADIVLQVMSLPGNGDGWQQAAALESMRFGGTALPTDSILAMVDAAVAQDLDDQCLIGAQSLDP